MLKTMEQIEKGNPAYCPCGKTTETRHCNCDLDEYFDDDLK